MKLSDYRTHHRRCGHALGEIEDYVKVAIGKNLKEIGISAPWMKSKLNKVRFN